MIKSAWAVPGFIFVLGCAQHEVGEAELGRSFEAEVGWCDPGPGKVDVLIVLDDSASMLGAQDRLAANLASIANVYASSERLDYRIAVTTTDVANPYCDSSPEDGAFETTTCRSRLDDFTVGASHESPVGDARQTCVDACPHPSIVTLPTTTDFDAVAQPRPWIEGWAGGTNLPEDVAPSEALACFGLVGVAGCVYESPLEAAYQALMRAQNPEDPNYGFLRPEAALFVMFVTDEADCSVQPGMAGVFSSSGQRVFWPDGAKAPTSAICWNAGMQCTGGPGQYDDCSATDFGMDGVPSSAEEAVMFPVQRYVDLLSAIEAEKAAYPGATGQRVFTSAVSGVEFSWEGADPIYADAADPAFQAGFGIGPACTRPGDAAVPPGRVRAVVQQFAEHEQPLHSICSDDFRPALACIPGGVSNAPSCIDVQGWLEGISSVGECRAFETRGGELSKREIPPCGSDGQMPEDTEACVQWRRDRLGDGDATDDISLECLDRGSALEGQILRTVPLREAACISMVCEVSQ